MKACMRWSALTALLMALVAVTPARGDTFEAAPVQSLVVRGDPGGQTRVAVAFDLSGLKEGPGRQIEEAWVEWRLTGTGRNESLQFEAWPITGPWSAASVSLSPGTLAVGEEPAAFWDIQPIDNLRNGDGFVRLDVLELARGWADGQPAWGVVVRTPDLSAAALAGQLDEIRLRLRYGFGR